MAYRPRYRETGSVPPPPPVPPPARNSLSESGACLSLSCVRVEKTAPQNLSSLRTPRSSRNHGPRRSRSSTGRGPAYGRGPCAIRRPHGQLCSPNRCRPVCILRALSVGRPCSLAAPFKPFLLRRVSRCSLPPPLPLVLLFVPLLLGYPFGRGFQPPPPSFQPAPRELLGSIAPPENPVKDKRRRKDGACNPVPGFHTRACLLWSSHKRRHGCVQISTHKPTEIQNVMVAVSLKTGAASVRLKRRPVNVQGRISA